MNQIKRNFAIVIGINDYIHPIPPLNTAVNDAKELADILEKRYQYSVLSLLDREANYENLNSVLNNLEKDKKIKLSDGEVQVQSDDRILFYFAGHGYPQDAQESEDSKPAGFWIPQDGKLEDKNTWLSMQALHDALTALECRHLLIILDCCFAGRFHWTGLTRNPGGSHKVYRQSYDRFIKYQAQQVITSAAHDEKALDSHPLFGQRGEQNGHSPFTDLLLKVLGGKADKSRDIHLNAIIEDGVITAHELFTYLQNKLGQVAERQTPCFFQLKKHDKGEYIFPLPGFNPGNLEPIKLDESKNPYKGLESFEQKDSQLFFGRSTLIQKLREEFVDKNSLTVVMGRSGSGKSSLVKAGLIPALTSVDGNQPDSQQQWEIFKPIRFGDSPFSNLNNALIEKELPEIAQWDKNSTSGQGNLAESLEVWSQNHPNSKLLIVIDQCEELITLCRNQEERGAFLRSLAEAVTSEKLSNQLRIVLTLRDDFEPQIRDAIDQSNWQKAWSEGRFFVTPMNREELQEAIEEPAAARALFFESPKLVNQLIDEVIQMPGALPLLSFTLSKLYLMYLEAEENDGRNDRTITEADYNKLGGVTHSLIKTADDEYKALVQKPEDEDVIRDMILRMVTVSGSGLARRQVPLSELEYPEPKNKRVQEAIERLVEARLLVSGQDTQRNRYVEAAHDAFVQGWPKLSEWIEEVGKAQKSFTLQQRLALTTAVNEWAAAKQRQDNDQATGYLWHDNPGLAILQEVLTGNNNWLNKLETEFVEQSIKQKIKQKDELTQNRINELTPLANSRFRDHEQLEALTHILKAGKLLQKLIGEGSPHISRETRFNTQLILRQILSKIEEKNRFMLQSQTAHAVDFSHDGQIIATVDRNGIVNLFDPQGKRIDPRQMNGDMLMKIFDVPKGEMVTLRGGSKYLYLLTPDGKLLFPNLYLSPDGEIFAQPGQQGEGRVTLYSRDGGEPKTLTGLDEETFMTVAFSPDGQVIASGGWKGWLSLWNRDGETIKTQFAGGVSLNTIDFNPNGEMLATGSNDGKVRLWKPDGTHLHEFQAHSDAIWGLCFSSNGEMLATGSNDRTVKLWKPDGTEVKTLEGHKGVVRAVAFNPNDSQNLASASDDGSVKIWNLGGTSLKILDQHEDSVYTVRFSPDGKTILTTSGHGKVSFWRTDGTLFKQENWHNGPISTLDFSANGERIVTASGDKEVILRNSDGGFIANIKQWDGSEWDGIEVLGASFSPNNQVIALADQQGSVKLYNLGDRTFKTLRDGSGDPSSVWAVKFSPDGNILASAHSEGVVALWQDGSLLNTLPRDQNYTTFTKTGGVYYNSVLGIDFSPNGDLIASAHLDGTVRLWQLDGSSNEPLILGEPSSSVLVRSLRFSPKRDLIASAYTDGTVKLWNLDGSLHKILEGHKSGVTAVDFSPNRNTLASASEDQTVILWDLERSQDLDGLLQRGCEWAEGYLTNNPNITNEDRQIILDNLMGRAIASLS